MRYAVEQIGKKGISSLYISNGTCFDENIIHLLARYSNVVRFSINGFDENSYEVVHGVRLFHNVIHNLSNLIKLRKKYGRSNLLLIGVTYIVTKQNYQKIFEFGMMLKMMGVDFFLIRGLNPTREVFTSEEERVIKSQILKLHGLKDDDYFVSASVKKLSSGYRRKQKFARCYVPSYRLFIDCRGDIHLCFSSLINGGKPLGNIRNISLADFWRSEDMERIRCNLRNGCFYGFCSKFCDHSEFNQSIDWIRGKLEATKNEKFIKIPRKWVTSFAEAQI